MILSFLSPLPSARNHGFFGKLVLFLIILWMLVACAPDQPGEIGQIRTSPSPNTPTSHPTQLQIPTFTSPAIPTDTPPSLPSPHTNPSKTPDTTGLSLIIQDGPGPGYELVFSLPVGEGGVQYRGLAAPEGLIEGPNVLGVFADGTFGLADPATSSLLRFSVDGQLLNRVELRAVGIHMLSGMAVSNNDFMVLEAGFGPDPQIYRIYRITQGGQVSDTYDLPEWARLDGGLSGISAWQTGEVLLEMGGSRTYLFVTAAGELAEQPVVAPLEIGVIRWSSVDGEQGYTLSTSFSYGLGGLRLLSPNRDGTFFVVREDVIDQQVIQVDQTVHWMNEQSEQLGLARMPQAESLYYVPGNLAVGPDGQVYGLIPHQDRLDVIRLIFYHQLEPLEPEAMPPLIQGYR